MLPGFKMVTVLHLVIFMVLGEQSSSMCVIECEVICTALSNLNICQKWLGYDQTCSF